MKCFGLADRRIVLLLVSLTLTSVFLAGGCLTEDDEHKDLSGVWSGTLDRSTPEGKETTKITARISQTGDFWSGWFDNAFLGRIRFTGSITGNGIYATMIHPEFGHFELIGDTDGHSWIRLEGTARGHYLIVAMSR